MRVLLGGTVCAATAATVILCYVYFDRSNLPDPEAFTRFEFATIGRIYDVNGQPLMEMGSEARQITQYAGIPPIVRDAILSAEDKNFFSHSGIDYVGLVRAVCKMRLGTLLGRLARMQSPGAAGNTAIFPQGGSTITQQLVRGYFLKTLTAEENSDQLRYDRRLARALSKVIGARTVNLLLRKVEEIRLSLWIEEKMQRQFGSKRRAKEELLARYASLIYMGNGQYGFARGAEYYFGRPLSMLTVDDADKAALLAGTAKSTRYYAPSASESARVLQRRNRTLALMAANGYISAEQARRAGTRPMGVVAHRKAKLVDASAVVDNVLDELAGRNAGLGLKDLRQGRIQIFSTVDAGAQRIANEALEHGLSLYEQRHPGTRRDSGLGGATEERRCEHPGGDGGPPILQGRNESLRGLQPRDEGVAATRVHHEADRVSGGIPGRVLRSG